MGYFNFFDEWAMDPKVQSMDERFRSRLVAIFCLRNIGPTADLSDDEIAVFLRISRDETRKTKELFRKQGFINGEGWNVKNWEKRQCGESESAARVRKHRQEKLQRNVTVTLQGNAPPLQCNVTRNVTSRAPVLTSDTYDTTDTSDTWGGVTPQPPTKILGPEYQRIGDLAIQLGADVSYGPWVMHQGMMGVSAEWIEAAIRRCPKDKFGQSYLAGMLRGFTRDGGPPKEPNGSSVKPEKPPVSEAELERRDEERRRNAKAYEDQRRKELDARKRS